MRRILLSGVLILAAVGFFVIAGGSSKGTSGATYKIELDNAFGLVNGADFKVAGVRAGSIKSIDLCGYVKSSGCQNPLHALITVNVTQAGFGAFRTDAFCQSRPQSLIGEYYIECQPGQYGTALHTGATIPVTRTQATIPADLVQNVMRLPYRQRFTLIINELGAAVAGRSDDLKAALARAVPALTETDNLLALLANDATTLRNLNVNADAVVTALANNSGDVQRFIVQANNAATDTTRQIGAFQATWHKLPGFLEQLRPTLADLSSAIDANQPTLVNLQAASGQLTRFFHDLVPFSNESLPSLRSLGQTSVVGKSAVQAALPLVSHLNQFASHTPELARNLAIVLRDLDNRSRSVEPDPRSPTGRGFTGLEALLQYVFNQTTAISYYGPYGHVLGVDAFVDKQCSPYATPRTLAQNLAQPGGSSARKCYSWLGPNQPGINSVDPSNPGGCVPDPGGVPPASPAVPAGTRPTAPIPSKCPASAGDTSGGSTPGTGTTTTPAASAKSPPGSSAAARTPTSPASGAQTPANPLASILGTATNGATAGQPNTTSAASQPQQLLNYLLAP